MLKSSSRLRAGEGSVAQEEAGEPSFEVSEVNEERWRRGPERGQGPPEGDAGERAGGELEWVSVDTRGAVCAGRIRGREAG